ncbi:MAG: hypothetical protein COB08_015060 [Rhodobacteraceae bacterium]|nr:hypothetical protein [Paracoccaceae bacterium]
MSYEEPSGYYIVRVTPHESHEHGACFKVERTLDGKPHCIDRAAVTIESIATGKIVEEKYYVNGQLHRKDGPAERSFSVTGVVEMECWYLNGEEHREDGPDTVFRHPETGKILSEGWALNGKTHRVDGPAYISIDYETGVVVEEDWMQHGEYFRADGGPACITRDPITGEVTHEAYWEEIERHKPGNAPDLSDSDPSQ